MLYHWSAAITNELSVGGKFDVSHTKKKQEVFLSPDHTVFLFAVRVEPVRM
jgi:hypothetical protein